METTINDALLTRFLANDLSVVEKEQVEQWIAAKEENRLYFLELQRAWQLAGMQEVLDHALGMIDTEEKWAAFRQSVEPEDRVTGEEEVSARYVEMDSSRNRRRWLLPAIAASVLGAAGMVWLLTPATPPHLLVDEQQLPAIQFVDKREVNQTGKDKTIRLPDSTVITLADKSELTYRVPFVDKRVVTLTGKAAFKVTHDTTKPFMVYSKEIATTDLGTEFTVTAWPQGRKVSVRLYEGKVVINPVDAVRTPMKQAVYLEPGQEFTFDGAGKVSWFRKHRAAPGVRDDNRPEEDPLIPEDGGTWYMFNNQPLDQVLKELSALYGVPISYNKRDVRNSYFTAKYKATDSLETILERIARLNKLTITQINNGYKLSK